MGVVRLSKQIVRYIHNSEARCSSKLCGVLQGLETPWTVIAIFQATLRITLDLRTACENFFPLESPLKAGSLLDALKALQRPFDAQTLFGTLCDVEALAQSLQASPSRAAPPASAVELAGPNGPKILHSKAKKKYLVGAHMLVHWNNLNIFAQLTNEQLKGIKPISIEPNPYGGPYLMKHYNACDVEKLANRLGLPAQAPGTSKKRVSAPPSTTSRNSKGKTAMAVKTYNVDHRFDHNYQEGAFDGMSADDAYYKCEQPPSGYFLSSLHLLTSVLTVMGIIHGQEA
ncbi:uncharacterized protein PHACADRAFT_188944 [Phanerochaete carnosa HHB-10118-sp]|uniref:Uncharacterized protein n=1 Tax=Phanerochaete carnosa (strain HHB-10118-sp) TaxID=650164 RepID=K5VRL1_PHACS|nr:uncharacterized protein PHACADRAFT_188944 [Phanerochaete carnosa HHB-10118-sp]EKM49224.1 hypothetical protein PHACADRAFT_188944 [Phanerochaete carnosa HHB-10118-sp]